MIRYLRVDMIGQQHNTLYCTLTQIKVYGKGMHQILKENLRKINEDFSDVRKEANNIRTN